VRAVIHDHVDADEVASNDNHHSRRLVIERGAVAVVGVNYLVRSASIILTGSGVVIAG
jgi:hypothetical protein